MCLFSCSKGDDGSKKSDGDSKKEEQKTDPDEGGYKAPVEIDGDFSDWAAIDASKLTVATCASVPKWNGLKVMKVYLDDLYMFVYFEFDSEVLADRSVVHAHVYFNSDNDETTGGCSNQWNPGCIEYMGEGDIIQDEKFVSYDPSLSIWTGEELAEGWEWEKLFSSGSGLFSGAGSGNAYEMAMMLEMFQDLQVPFQFGMDVQQGWSSVGVLPNAEVTEDNPTGRSGLLTITKK